MKPFFLLPARYRYIGLILLLPAIALMIAVIMYEYSVPFLRLAAPTVTHGLDLNNYDLSDEVAVLLVLTSLFMIAFSKEKIEDEYVQEVRLKALQVSVYINYLVLAVGILCFYGLSFLYVLYGNLFTILVIFILVYQYHVHLKPRLSKPSLS